MSECKHEWSKGKMFYGKSDCPYCEINRLKAELEEVQELVARYDDIKDDLQMDKAELQNQLAEAKAEVERLSALTGEWCKTAEMYRRFETEARKQTAREIVEMLRGAPNGFYIANMIKRRYGLEDRL